MVIGIEAYVAGISILVFIFPGPVQEPSGTGLGLLVPASALVFIPVPNRSDMDSPALKKFMKGSSSVRVKRSSEGAV